MSTLAIVAQVVVALGIFNVWLVRRNRATPYRPDGAENMEQEFRRYGLSDATRMAVGVTKVTLAVLLLVGLLFTPVAVGAAAFMAILMIGAVIAHVRVGDPWVKALPALTMLTLSVLVVVGHAA